jgi:hypothetical protein
MNAFESATKNNRARELEQELKALFTSKNTSETRGFTTIPATFMRAMVTL